MSQIREEANKKQIIWSGITFYHAMSSPAQLVQVQNSHLGYQDIHIKAWRYSSHLMGHNWLNYTVLVFLREIHFAPVQKLLEYAQYDTEQLVRREVCHLGFGISLNFPLIWEPGQSDFEPAWETSTIHSPWWDKLHENTPLHIAFRWGDMGGMTTRRTIWICFKP